MKEIILLFVIAFGGVATLRYFPGPSDSSKLQQVLGDTEYCVNRMIEKNQPYQKCFSDYYTANTRLNNYVHSL